MSGSIRAGARLGPYHLVESIGEGGMGTVFRAEGPDGVVALKTLHSHYAKNADVRRRFLEEGKIQAQLRHPNLVHVYDVLETPAGVALIMEYVPGETLKDYIRNNRRGVEQVVALKLTLHLVQGLGHAHKMGIVHRDIKPANVFLGTAGQRSFLKLGDFGIAKDAELTSHTATGMMMGTANYIAPEQIRDARRADHRADLYSVGVSLYEMLTGRVPYRRKTQWAVMQAHISAPVPSVRRKRPQVDEGVEQIVTRAMQKRAADRFASCDEMAGELLEAIERIECEDSSFGYPVYEEASDYGDQVDKTRTSMPDPVMDLDDTMLIGDTTGRELLAGDLHDAPPVDASPGAATALAQRLQRRRRDPGMRLDKRLQLQGLGSAEHVRRLISGARVAVDGEPVTDPAFLVQRAALVACDGQILPVAPEVVVLMMHKPPKHLTALQDPDGRPTLGPFLPRGGPRLFPIGSLPFHAEGMLLWTNDTELARRMLYAGPSIEERWLIGVPGDIPDEHVGLARMRNGLSMTGGAAAPKDIFVAGHGEGMTFLDLTAPMDRLNEAQMLLKSIELKVVGIRRIAIGPIDLCDLPPRQTRPLEDCELAQLEALLDLIESEADEPPLLTSVGD